MKMFGYLTFLFAVTLLVACEKSEWRSDIITIQAIGVNEECDTYKHLWIVDSVSDVSYDFLIGELLYSKKASEALAINRKGNQERREKLFASGQLSKSAKSEHYTCTNTWFLLTHDLEIEY